MDMNSKEYWNARFEGDWDQNGGPKQTTAFAKMFLSNMPDWLNREFSKGCSICDWGCAEGDAAGLIAEMFPLARLTGIDFAINAVVVASRRFPNVRFKCEDWTLPLRKKNVYDCVLVSNVLEHFRTPYEVLWNSIAPHAKKFIVVLVPYEEYLPRRCKEHEFTFSRMNIPFGNADWQCVGFKVMNEVPDKAFPGPECMIIYAKRDLKRLPDVKISDIDGAAEFSCKLEALVSEKDVLTEKVKTAETQRQLRFEKDQQIIATNTTLKAKISELDARLKSERETAAQAQKALEGAKADLSAMRVTLDAEKKVSAGGSEQIAVLKAALQFAANRPQATETRLLECSQEVRELRTALDAQRTEAIERAERLGRMSGQVEALRGERDAAKVSCAAMQSQRDALKTECDALKTECADMHSQRDALKTECDALKTEKGRLLSRLSEAESSLADKEEKVAENAQRAENAEEISGRLKTQCDGYVREIEKLRGDVAAHAETVAAERARAKDLDAQLSATRSDLVAKVQKIDKIQSKYHELKLAKAKSVCLCKEKSASLKTLSCKYKALANSKLGRLTLKWWKVKDRIWQPKTVKKAKQCANGKKPELAAGDLQKGDEKFYERIASKCIGMPESNGSRYYKKLGVKIGIICDQFYWDSIYSAANFVYIRPECWQEDIKGIDYLLMVSAWHGLRDGTDWQGLPYEGTKRRLLAYENIDCCKRRNVPTIFYSKEDPPSYKEFLGIAKRCDYVFTSAEECVNSYKTDCNHSRVWPLRFCINPEYHNPVGMRHSKQPNGVIFSGSWMTKFPDRCKDLAVMFDGVLSAGREMRIIDRCYQLRSDERYRYPEKYLKTLSPAIEHKNLQKVHKLYDWAVNINTVKDSRTMFANRVFELQASGNLLLSNYSVGVSNLFPTVFMPYDSNEVGRILNSFTPDEVYERQISGVRRVMTGETCYDRLAEMLSCAGMNISVQSRHVLVVADKITDKIRMMFESQSYRDKELVAASEVTEQVYEGADIVAFFHEDYDYGVFYLEDLINGFKYTDSDYITKDAFLKHGQLVDGAEHTYVGIMRDKYRSIFWRSKFERKYLMRLHGKEKIPNGYSIDHFNLEVKRSKVEHGTCEVSVVIPVHNNGWYLYGRAFAALRRSSLFEKMEIIIVDDGSTDGFTPKMVKHLEWLYPNVRTFFFSDGGSGTPSRPRNKGVKLAKTNFIIFHDPDNEAICDGYATLFKEMEPEKLDVALGNTVRCDGRNMMFDYYSVIKHNNGNNVLVTDGRKVLAATKFIPANIQTMVIRKAFLEKHNLEQVVGGIGEDSHLCNQMMLLAKRFKVFPVRVQIYYAERSDSIVNAISENFFIKHKRTEIDRVKWLRASGLFDVYMARRFAEYVKGWYFQKLNSVAPENRESCCRKLLEILLLFGKGNPSGDPKIGKFIELVQAGRCSELFGTVISPPPASSQGKKQASLMSAPSFKLLETATFMRHTCPLKGECTICITGAVLEAKKTQGADKHVLMCIVFENPQKKVLNTGKLPYSPKFGEHVFLKAGVETADTFRTSVKVPVGASTLTLGFMRWDAKSEVSISNLKVMAMDA